MKKKKGHWPRKWRKNKLFFVFVLLFCLIFVSADVKASWVDRGGSSIYAGGDSEEEDIGQGVGSLNEDEAAEDKEMDEGSGFFVDLINTILCWILSTIGSTLFSLLDLIGASLDRLIYGRLVAENTLFTFDLGTGNVYGIVAAAIFNIIRGVTITGLILIFAARIASGVWKKGELAKSGLKDAFGSLVLSLMLLLLMPNFLDLALYVRDVILYTIGTEGASSLFGSESTTSIISVLAAAANENIISGLIYIAAILLNLYFVLGYVGIALTMTTDFVLFPLVVLKASYDRQALSNWVWEMVACMCVPVVDAVLIMIPSFLGIYASSLSLGSAIGVSIVQLIICYLIIPARSAARNILGLRSGLLENAGLSTAAVLGMAAARGIGKAIGGEREAKKNAELDRERANAEEDLARLEEDEKEAYETSGGSFKRSEGMASAQELLGRKEDGMGDGTFAMAGEKEDDSPFGKEQNFASALDSHIKASEDDMTPEELEKLPHLLEDEARNAEACRKLDADIQDLEEKKADLESRRRALLNDNTMGESRKEDVLDSLNQAISDSEEQLKGMHAEREALMSVDEKLRAANKKKSQFEEEYQDALNDPELGQKERNEKLDALHEEIEAADHEIAGLKRQKQQIKVAEEKEILKTEPSVLRNELAGLSASAEELGNQTEALQRERRHLEERRGDYAAGTRQYDAIGEELRELDKRIAAKNIQLGENKVRREEINGALKKQELGLRDRQAYNLQERIKAQNDYEAAKGQAEEVERALADIGGSSPQNALKRRNLNRELNAARQKMGETKRRLGEISGEDKRIAARLQEISPEFGSYTQEDYKEAENQLKAARGRQALRKAQIQKEIAGEQLRMEESQSLEERQIHRTRIAALKGDIADCGVKSAQIDQALEGVRQRQSQGSKTAAGASYKNAGRSIPAAFGMDEGYMAKRRAVMERYANIDNFERPEFSDISHEKRAQLYRERAMRTQRICSKRRLGGFVGAVAGGSLGVWLGAPGVGIGIMAGRSIGAEAGEGSAARYALKNSATQPVDYGGRPLDVRIASDLRDNTEPGQLRTLERIQAELSGALESDRFERAVQREFSSQDVIHGEIRSLFKKHGVIKENYERKRSTLLSELRPLTKRHVMDAERRVVESCAGSEYAALSETVKQDIVHSIVQPNMDVFEDLCENVYLCGRWQPHYEEYLND